MSNKPATPPAAGPTVETLEGAKILLEEANQQLEALTALLNEQVAPECEFSMNWMMLDGRGCNVQVTMRKPHLEQWRDALRARAGFVKLATEGGWKFNVPEPAPQPYDEKVAEAGGGKEAAQAVKEAKAQVARNTPLPDGAHTATIVGIKVLQGKEPDRMTVEFFTDKTHRYADFKVQNNPLDRALALLSPVMSTKGLYVEADGAKVVISKAYTLRCQAVYTLGKPYTTQDGKTSNYKDIVELRPLA